MNGGYRLIVFRDYDQQNKRRYLIEIVECSFTGKEIFPNIMEYREKPVIQLYVNNRRVGYELLDKMVNHFPENTIRYFGRPDLSNELLDHETLLMKTKQAIMEIPLQKRLFSEKTRESLLRQLTSNM
jgi:hypothetical protein